MCDCRDDTEFSEVQMWESDVLASQLNTKTTDFKHRLVPLNKIADDALYSILEGFFFAFFVKTDK